MVRIPKALGYFKATRRVIAIGSWKLVVTAGTPDDDCIVGENLQQADFAILLVADSAM